MLHFVAMYSQQRFFTFLYVLLDRISIGPRPIPCSDTDSRGDMPFCIQCIPNTLNNTTSTDVYQPDGLNCTMSLNCALPLGSAPVLLVNLSGIVYQNLQANSPFNVVFLPAIFQVRLTSLQECIDSLEDSISMNSGNSHHHPMQQRHHQSFGLVQEDNAHIFLSRQNALQRIHTNRIRASDPYPAARSHTTAQAYIGDPGKRWTTIGNKIKQIFAVNTTLNDSHAKKPQRRSIRQRFHNMKLNCQNMYCRRYDLEKVCTSQSMSTAEKDVCTACYPRKNLELIRDRCKVRRARSDQVLYRACILVGFSAMVAVLLYMVRSYRHSRRSQTSRNLTAETFSSSTLPMATTTSIAASSYSGLDMRTKHSHADGTQSFGTNAFMTERRPRNLGFFNREPRRRIRDVFDLESLGSIREGSGILKERVPVLPRAPNASLRGQSVTKNTKQAPQGASDEDHGSCSG